MQAHFGLRAEEFQVLHVIILATVQRCLREGQPDGSLRGRAPFPADLRSSISRRRISDVLGIPFETVRRHVDMLKACGLVVETARGTLSTNGGTLASLGSDDLPLQIAHLFTRASNVMMRACALRCRPTRTGH